jgi:hypothetical protein
MKPTRPAVIATYRAAFGALTIATIAMQLMDLARAMRASRCGPG